MNKEYTSGIIVEKNEIAEGIIDLWIAIPEIAEKAIPGQFVCYYCTDGARLLPRPISICDVDEEQHKLRLVFRVVGEGTKELASKKVFESITLMGPLGNGYRDLDGQNCILVGGGIGIPPMLYLARCLAKQGKPVTAVLGYRSNDTFLLSEFEEVAQVYIASDDGSVGTKGTVLDAIRENGVTGDQIAACGPMPMLRGLAAYSEEKGITAYVSLEERMACGIGACLGCITKTREVNHHSQVKNTRICTEGPVFNVNELDFNK